MKKLYDLPFSPIEPSKHWEEILRHSKSDKSRKGAIMKRFLDLIEINFRHPEGRILESSLAPKLNTSASNLGKICREVIKVAPSDCIQARLISEACKLLIDEPELTVEDIARSLGYENQAGYFSRFFNKYTGYSPTAFRKANHETI